MTPANKILDGLPCAVNVVRGAICALPQVRASRFTLCASHYLYAIRPTRFVLLSTLYEMRRVRVIM